MKRIIIDVSRAELNFMREALETKHTNMMLYLDTCEDEADKPEEEQDWIHVKDLTEEEFMDQVEAIKEEAKVFKYTPKKKPAKKAPWGYKKDGTPKARPGRKV